MKYKGIIFDLDGTTLDTIYDLSDSVNEVLIAHGYPVHSYSEYKKKIGKGFRDLITVSMPAGNHSEAEIDSALQEFLEVYSRKYMDKTVPYTGIVELLTGLTAMKIQLAINSNKRTDYTNNLVKKNFSNFRFVDVIGERQGIPRKPSPVSANEIVAKMGLKPEEVLYIGDSKTDILTGKNAGMDTVGVLWGFRDYAELEEYGASYIVSSPDEIMKIVKEAK